MNFNEEFDLKVNTVNKWVTELLPKTDSLYKVLTESMSYSVMAGGKRIRPILVESVCSMLGGDTQLCKHFATAVEFIHTYSLIHDDLPCMDNDDYRRGMPTNHKKFGEAIALLAGDSLLTYAFKVASESKTDPNATIKGIHAISSAAGLQGMIGGQVVDIEGAKDFEQLQTVHKLKTGALIRLSCYLGALVAGANDEEISKIDEFACHLGIAFQIKDDILDVESTNEELGKPVGSDEKRNIITYVTLFGIDGAKEKLDYHTKCAKNALSSFGNKAGFLLELANYLLNRKN